ncbi:MAG TPA: MerR family transcriptional regulator [Candidatus Kapabacteria bacterium]|nr:MerR family transcriptional regulator [Candidatus Kapabacteria bacterium]
MSIDDRALVDDPISAEFITSDSIVATNGHKEVSRSRRTMKDLSIPKLYYSISEVSRLTGLEPYVLRYWESEFAELKPQKNRAGNRIYSNRDIKFILRIKELLRERRYTIEGAKHILKQDRAADSEAPVEASAPDPAQIPLATAPLSSPQAILTPEEIHSIKDALLALRSILKA